MKARETWNRISRYYDSHVKTFTKDLQLYAHALGPHDRVMEVGCGSGRVLRHLVEMGHAVTGVDISEAMIERARARLHPYVEKGLVELVLHDFAHGTLGHGYTKTLVSYYTFNWVIDHPAVFLSHISQSMFLHSTILMDLFVPRTLSDPDLEGVWEQDVIELEDQHIRIRERRTMKDGIEERVRIYEETVGDHEIVSHRKYYSPAEIRELLMAAGFTSIEFCKEYSEEWDKELPERDLKRNFVVKASR